MSWTRPSDLRSQVQRLWDRGLILSCLVTGETVFPKRLTLKGPSSAELSSRFDEVRGWIAELKQMSHCRIEMREVRHRLLGTNSIPQEVWVDSVGDALAFIGKKRDAVPFVSLVERTRSSQPNLLDWLAKQPLRALELAAEWDRLLAIVTWIENHPHPDLYLRQVDIPGVHTKFIEAHRGVLSQLLDIVLPPEAIDTTASGAGLFTKRYGFRDKPERIRFRILDPAHLLLPGDATQDITLDAGSFARLDPKVSQVFITENEINFLAFPQVKDSMILFGGGYGFDALEKAEWLSRCRIFYWGDIDTHGFAILDQFRSRFSHAESFLMDRATLLAFEAQWGEEEKQTLRDLSRLNEAEQELYDDLRDNLIRRNLRLEQERIGFAWVQRALQSAGTSS